MNCPNCNQPMIDDIELIDIGVGNQEHHRGWQCDPCQVYIAACNQCGRPDNMPHEEWCGELEPLDWTDA